MSQKKKYTRGYLPEYLKMGFIESVVNKQHPMCLFCHKTLCSENYPKSQVDCENIFLPSIQMVRTSPFIYAINIFRKYIKNFKIIQQSVHYLRNNMHRMKMD